MCFAHSLFVAGVTNFVESCKAAQVSLVVQDTCYEKDERIAAGPLQSSVHLVDIDITHMIF